jgi:two-component system NtrC family sensor kinase
MAGERILIVDDEVHITHLCTKLLTQHGYAAEGVTNGREAIARLEAEARPLSVGFHLLVVDIKMPGIEGLTVLRRGRELDPHLAAIVITDSGILARVVQALPVGPQRFLLKPFHDHELIQAVEETLLYRHREQERWWQQVQWPILATSQALWNGTTDPLAAGLLRGILSQIGADRAALLLLENGTGRLYVTKATGPAAGMAVEAPIPVEPDIVAWASHQEEPLVLDGNSRGMPDLSVWALLMGSEIPIGVCLPLRAQRTIGLLCLGRRAGHVPFASTDIHLLHMMTGPIAIAIENVRRYRELLDTRDDLRAVLDSLQDEVIVLNRERIITDANATFLHHAGLKREEAIGRPCWQIYHGDTAHSDDTIYPCLAAEVESTGQPVKRMHLHRDRMGKVHYVDITASPLRDREGSIIGIVEARRDVMADRQLEDSLAVVRAVGQELLFALDEAKIAYLVVNAAEKIINADRCDLWKVDEEEKVLQLLATTAPTQATTLSPLPMDDTEWIPVAVARSRQPIYLPDVRRDLPGPEGADTARSELGVPLGIKDRVLGVLYAASARPAAFEEEDQQIFATLADQAALALENARLYRIVAEAGREWAETFDAITDGISIHDAHFRIVRANRALAERLGLPLQALIGRPCYELLHRNDAPMEGCPHFQTLQSGQPQTREMELPDLKGVFLVSTYPIRDEHGAVKASIHVLKDITEQKQIQAHLIQTEKMAALGRLAASLAHEINNPLQALRSGLSLLRNRQLSEEKRQRYLEIANREVERLITTVEKMLNFSRPSAEQRERVDVNDLLEETLFLVSKQLQRSRVTVRRQLAPRLPQVEIVAGQIRQVFLNIILNALDAMPDGGELTVATGWDRDHQAVWISFTDTGVGIPEEDQPRIFEPFFTRKFRGTGLGLTISYSIVERHGGRIELESRVGQGSRFTVFLPI